MASMWIIDKSDSDCSDLFGICFINSQTAFAIRWRETTFQAFFWLETLGWKSTLLSHLEPNTKQPLFNSYIYSSIFAFDIISEVPPARITHYSLPITHYQF